MGNFSYEIFFKGNKILIYKWNLVMKMVVFCLCFLWSSYLLMKFWELLLVFIINYVVGFLCKLFFIFREFFVRMFFWRVFERF